MSEQENKLTRGHNLYWFSYEPERATYDASAMAEDDPQVDMEGLRFTPKKILMTNPFEGKLFQETLIIRNIGTKPIFVRILSPSASGIYIKTIKEGRFLCSGMYIKRTVTYKVQMMTLVHSCVIPVYVNDEKVINYPVKVFTTPVNLIIEPDIMVDLGRVDASPTPVKRTLTMSNPDVKPVKFFIDLGPNAMELSVEPIRGLVMGNSSVDIELSITLMEEGEFSTEFWIITENPNCIHVLAQVGIARIEPLHTFTMKSFTFIHFPVTYYGATSIRSLVIHNNSMNQSFFCVLGEVDLETHTLKDVLSLDNNYRYFKINPEEGRLLPNDIRVFQLTYSPTIDKKIPKCDYHLVMMRVKRLSCKDLNSGDYLEDIFLEHQDSYYSIKDLHRESTDSAISEECTSKSELDLKSSKMTEIIPEPFVLSEIRLMLYGQVEEVSVTIVPDELTLLDQELNKTETRVFQIQNTCNVLPIIFRYKKIAFVEMKPKIGCLKPLEAIEISAFITPKSYARVSVDIIFDLLYQNEFDKDSDAALVGQLVVPFRMETQITGERKGSMDSLLVKNFKFKKPNQKPNKLVMDNLLKGQTYVGLPDDRPPHNLPDPKGRLFKTIYAALPRYQATFNEYALTQKDKELLAMRKYYDIYIKSTQKKVSHSAPAKVGMKCLTEKSGKALIKKDIHSAFQEFIPLTPIQLASIDLIPRSSVVENVAFNSTHIHTFTIYNRTNVILKIYLKPRKRQEYNFINGNRLTIGAHSEKPISFVIYIDSTPIHNYELDILINNCFVVETSILVKARPKHLTLSVDMLTFYENEPPSKFIELRNELNVDIPFQWKVPSVFSIDPVEGEVVSGRFVACMISFEIGMAENMVYDLGVHTENKFYNLKVLIEGTDYKVRIPKILSFGEVSFNVSSYKMLPMTNLSQQELVFEVLECSLADGMKVKPREGTIPPVGTFNLTIIVNRNILGNFLAKIEIVVAHRRKFTSEVSGIVLYPQINFRPETIRFRKMSASSFDIACVTILNTSSVVAMITFDTERFPEFNYSEYTNTPFLTSKDVIYVQENEEKQISIHFYPFNPLVTSFPLPLNINKVAASNAKSRTMLFWRPIVKAHAQVLSYKLEVKSWRYHFKYYPYFNYKNVTSHDITIKNPTKSVLKFCIRLDELVEPFSIRWKSGAQVVHYDYSIVVELEPDEGVTFEAVYAPEVAGTHTIRLPVYVREDFTQDMHNYFYFVGEYPQATYKFPEDGIYLGYIPLHFTISKKIIVDMMYHSPECNCSAFINDNHCYIEIDTAKPKKISSYKIVQIVFNCARPHLLNSKLRLKCNCAGPNFEIDVYGGCENNFFTVHACIQYFKYSSSMSFNALFEASEREMHTISTITVQDPDREEAIKHNYITDLPYFQSGTDPFDIYMKNIVHIFEKYLMEEVFFCTKSYRIPDTICIPEVKVFEKQGKKEGVIKLPVQFILNHLMGTSLMSQFDIKYTEKKPVWSIIRKYYRDLLNFLLSLNCYVNMIKPEMLLPYDMYKDYMIFMDRKSSIKPSKNFHLIAKQCWLDFVMQCYKSLVLNRITQFSVTPATLSRSTASGLSASMVRIPKHVALGASTSIFNQAGTILLCWMDRHFQEQKVKFASPKYGNHMTEELNRQHIENFDDDLNDSLAIIAVLLGHCSFLEDTIMGIYAPATNRMEKFNNAYIVIKILDLLRASFHLKPLDIIEPNTIHMMMFMTYLFDFLMPLKSKETIYFNAELSKTKEEQITILNCNSHRIYYNVIFFNNTDDLFSVEESNITIEADSTFKLEISYFAKFLRIQKTVLLLSGELPGYQYTNSKIYYLEGRPDLENAGENIKVQSTVYKIGHVNLDFKSPYPVACNYNLYFAPDQVTDIFKLEESLISYEYILNTKSLTRIKFPSAVVSADESGSILMTAQVCSIINTNGMYWLVFRHEEIGDFIVKLEINTHPMKRYSIISLVMKKNLSEFPCTCPKKRPDVNNTKCPRNVKVLIPSRNEYLWAAVMEFFLCNRDPDEEEFWNIYRNTPIGSYVVKRILYDHKKFLSSDMDYFMNQSFKYNVSVKQPEDIVVQKTKTIKEAPAIDTMTEILVHFNKIVRSFYLTLKSNDEKETRVFKVRVSYE